MPTGFGDDLKETVVLCIKMKVVKPIVCLRAMRQSWSQHASIKQAYLDIHLCPILII